jgi:hypothetical protein
MQRSTRCGWSSQAGRAARACVRRPSQAGTCRQIPSEPAAAQRLWPMCARARVRAVPCCVRGAVGVHKRVRAAGSRRVQKGTRALGQRSGLRCSDVGRRLHVHPHRKARAQRRICGIDARREHVDQLCFLDLQCSPV